MRPLAASGAGSTDLRVKRSARDAKQRSAPSATCHSRNTTKHSEMYFKNLEKWMTGNCAAYELVFVFEQRRQRLDARL